MVAVVAVPGEDEANSTVTLSAVLTPENVPAGAENDTLVGMCKEKRTFDDAEAKSRGLADSRLVVLKWVTVHYI